MKKTGLTATSKQLTEESNSISVENHAWRCHLSFGIGFHPKTQETLQCRRPWFDSWNRKFPWRRDWLHTPVFLDFPGGSDGKESACNAGDPGLVPGLEDPLEEGMATHSSFLAWRFPMDRGAWQATDCGVTKSQTWLSDLVRAPTHTHTHTQAHTHRHTDTQTHTHTGWRYQTQGYTSAGFHQFDFGGFFLFLPLMKSFGFEGEKNNFSAVTQSTFL